MCSKSTKSVSLTNPKQLQKKQLFSIYAWQLKSHSNAIYYRQPIGGIFQSYSSFNKREIQILNSLIAKSTRNGKYKDIKRESIVEEQHFEDSYFILDTQCPFQLIPCSYIRYRHTYMPTYMLNIFMKINQRIQCCQFSFFFCRIWQLLGMQFTNLK